MKKGKLVGASGKSVPQEPLEELKGIARSCYVELQNKGLTAEQRVERGDTLKVVLATLEEKGWSMTLTQDGNMGDFEETDGEYDPTIKIPFCIADVKVAGPTIALGKLMGLFDLRPLLKGNLCSVWLLSKNSPKNHFTCCGNAELLEDTSLCYQHQNILVKNPSRMFKLRSSGIVAVCAKSGGSYWHEVPLAHLGMHCQFTGREYDIDLDKIVFDVGCVKTLMNKNSPAVRRVSTRSSAVKVIRSGGQQKLAFTEDEDETDDEWSTPELVDAEEEKLDENPDLPWKGRARARMESNKQVKVAKLSHEEFRRVTIDYQEVAFAAPGGEAVCRQMEQDWGEHTAVHGVAVQTVRNFLQENRVGDEHVEELQVMMVVVKAQVAGQDAAPQAVPVAAWKEWATMFLTLWDQLKVVAVYALELKMRQDEMQDAVLELTESGPAQGADGWEAAKEDALRLMANHQELVEAVRRLAEEVHESTEAAQTMADSELATAVVSRFIAVSEEIDAQASKASDALLCYNSFLKEVLRGRRRKCPLGGHPFEVVGLRGTQRRLMPSVSCSTPTRRRLSLVTGRCSRGGATELVLSTELERGCARALVSVMVASLVVQVTGAKNPLTCGRAKGAPIHPLRLMRARATAAVTVMTTATMRAMIAEATVKSRRIATRRSSACCARSARSKPDAIRRRVGSSRRASPRKPRAPGWLSRGARRGRWSWQAWWT
jgi:hypothetical protein